MLRKPFAFVALTVLLATLLPLPLGRAAAPRDEAITPEPFPFSDRYPAEVVLIGSRMLAQLVDSGIDIGNVRPLNPGARFPRPGEPSVPLMAEVYVNETEAQQLEELGFVVRPIPNESLRAAREYGPGHGASGPDAWPTYEQFVTRMEAISDTYPNIVRMVSIGQSVLGREIWMLKISDNPDLEEDEPEFKYTSTAHGDETVGVEMTVRLAELLASSYGVDPDLTELVDEMEIWLCPIHNPDGYVASTRYNAHGVDLNRDFPDRITDPVDDPAGREPETQAFMYFGYGMRFVMGANYHGGARVVNYPWDSVVQGNPDYAPDDTAFYYYSVGYAIRNPDIWTAPWPGPVIRGWEWYIIRGGMQDWAYHWRGEHHVTIELSDTKKPPYEQMDIYWDHNRDAMLWWMRQTLTGARGLVTDGLTGQPLDAEVDVVQIGKIVRTDPDVGDYHRLLLAGSYTLTCHAEGYFDQAWPITVVSGTATIQDCALMPLASYAVTVGSSAVVAGPGETVTHTLAVTNEGTVSDTYDISLTPGDWPATLLDTQVGPLGPGLAGQARVRVEIPLQPLTTTVLFSDVFSLRATSVFTPVSAQGTGTTYAAADLVLELSADLTDRWGLPGQAVTYTLYVTNSGDYTDSYSFALSGHTWPTGVSPTQTSALSPGESTTALVRVDIPGGPGGVYDDVTVTARSGWDPQIQAEITLHTLRLSSDVQVGDSQAAGAPGQVVTHTFPITNSSAVTDTYDVTLLPGDWPATLLDPQVGPLEPGSAGQAQVRVEIPWVPLTASVLFSDVLTLQVSSTVAPEVGAQAEGTTYATAELGLEITADVDDLMGQAGQMVTYTLRLTNTGAYTDSYTLALTSAGWPAQVYPTRTTPLSPGGTTTVWLQVSIPGGPGGEANQTRVRATSIWDALVQEELTLSTQRGWRAYLPLVMRRQE